MANKLREKYEEFRPKKLVFLAPVQVLYDCRLKPQAKVLFYIISSLSVKKGYCYATNNYLGVRLGLSQPQLNKWLNELEEANYIERKYYGINRERRIYINLNNFDKNFDPRKPYLFNKRKINSSLVKSHPYVLSNLLWKGKKLCDYKKYKDAIYCLDWLYLHEGLFSDKKKAKEWITLRLISLESEDKKKLFGRKPTCKKIINIGGYERFQRIARRILGMIYVEYFNGDRNLVSKSLI